MLQPSLPAWNVKKRKAPVFVSELNSSDENWDASSASATCILDKSACQLNLTPADSVEDDESEDVSRDVVEQTTGSSGRGDQLRKVGLDQSNANTNGRRAHETKKFEFQAYDSNDGSARKDPNITQSTTGDFRRSLAAELREARERLLQWMRQEMHNFLQGVPSNASTQVRLLRHSGDLDADVNPRTSPAAPGMQFGLQVNHTGEVGRAGRSGWIEKKLRDGDLCKSSGDGNAGLRFLADTNCRESFGCSKASHGLDKGSETTNALVDMGFGINTGSGLEEDHQEAECVGNSLQSARFAVVRKFETRNGIRVEPGFPDGNSQPGETDFGEQACSGGAFGYKDQQSGGTATSLKGCAHASANGNVRSMAEMSSVGLCNSMSSSSAAGKLLLNSLRMSAEERKAGYLVMPMHNQSATAEIQNPSQINLMWNMMSQSGRTANQNINGSSSFGYESERKDGEEGIDPYQEMAKNTSLYESSLGLIKSAFLPSVNTAVDIPFTSQIQSASQPNSSCLPMLLGMPAQTDGQNPSNMDTFLGLSMNGLSGAVAHRQVLEDLYLQDTQQHSLSKGLLPLYR